MRKPDNVVWKLVHCPIQPGDPLPAERKAVLVWCDRGL